MRFLVVLACLVAVCAAGTLPNSVEQRLLELADQNGDIDLFAPEEGVEGEIRGCVLGVARLFLSKIYLHDKLNPFRIYIMIKNYK